MGHIAKNVQHDAKLCGMLPKICGMVPKMCTMVSKMYGMVPKMCNMVRKCAAWYGAKNVRHGAKNVQHGATMVYTTKLTSLITFFKRLQSKSERKVLEALPSGGGQGPSQVPARTTAPGDQSPTSTSWLRRPGRARVPVTAPCSNKFVEFDRKNKTPGWLQLHQGLHQGLQE